MWQPLRRTRSVIWQLLRSIRVVAIEVRRIRPDEYGAGAVVTVAGYESLDDELEPEYLEQLADIAHRDAVAQVWVVAEDGEVLGTATYLPPGPNPLAEHDDPAAASFRMLAIAPEGQGRGLGRRLTEALVDRARADGAARLTIHSAPFMTAAHALYGSMGFTRAPELDWSPVPGIDLLGFVLEL